jgi:hypothetical protein
MSKWLNILKSTARGESDGRNSPMFRGKRFDSSELVEARFRFVILFLLFI